MFVDVPGEMERFIPGRHQGTGATDHQRDRQGRNNQKRRFEKIAGVLDIVRSAEMAW